MITSSFEHYAFSYLEALKYYITVTIQQVLLLIGRLLYVAGIGVLVQKGSSLQCMQYM
jgi:hypothetical protein